MNNEKQRKQSQLRVLCSQAQIFRSKLIASIGKVENPQVQAQLQEMCKKLSNLSSHWKKFYQETRKQITQDKKQVQLKIQQEESKYNNYLQRSKELRQDIVTKRKLMRTQEQELEKTLTRVKNLWGDNIEKLELHIGDQKLQVRKHQLEHKANLRDLDDLEDTQSLDFYHQQLRSASFQRSREDRPRQSVNNSYFSHNESYYSAEFDRLMSEMPQNYENPNGISMEKIVGGWDSDLESEKSYSSQQDVEKAIQILKQANFISEEQLQQIQQSTHKTQEINFLYDLLQYQNTDQGNQKPPTPHKKPVKEIFVNTDYFNPELAATTPKNNILICEEFEKTVISSNPVSSRGQQSRLDSEIEEIIRQKSQLKLEDFINSPSFKFFKENPTKSQGEILVNKKPQKRLFTSQIVENTDDFFKGSNSKGTGRNNGFFTGIASTKASSGLKSRSFPNLSV